MSRNEEPIWYADINKTIVQLIWKTSEELLGVGEILNSIKCLESLLKFKQQSIGELRKDEKLKKRLAIESGEGGDEDMVLQLSSVEECKTRIKISEILLAYTLNFNEARFHLEKAALILSESEGKMESLELLCKVSSFLIEIFYNGGALNLSKQWMKKAIKYSTVLGNIEWRIYFVLKESWLYLKEGSIQQSIQSLDSIQSEINRATSSNHLDQSSKLYLNVYLNCLRSHYYLISLDYKSIQEIFDQTKPLIAQLNQSYQSHRENPTGFLNILSLLNRSDQKGISSDTLLSIKQLNIYFNFIQVLYFIRIGNFKLIANDILLLLQTDIQQVFAELTKVNSAGSSMVGGLPVFYFQCGPHYLSCFYYILHAIHSRIYGELKVSLVCLDKALQMIDNRLKFIYESTQGHVTPEQMKESRALVRLKFLIHENIFYIRITEFDLDKSFQDLSYCYEIYSTYTMLFNDGSAECTIHYLSGIYLEAMGQLNLAKEHYTFALKKSNRFDAQIQSIIRLVCLSINSSDLDRASSLVDEYLFQLLDNHPQIILGAVSLLLKGIIQMLDNDLDSAKNLFRKASDLTRSSIGNTQLLSNIINSLTNLYLSSLSTSSASFDNLRSPSNLDRNILLRNIKSMIDNSILLSSQSNDLIGQIISLNFNQQLLSHTDTEDSDQFIANTKAMDDLLLIRLNNLNQIKFNNQNILEFFRNLLNFNSFKVF